MAYTPQPGEEEVRPLTTPAPATGGPQGQPGVRAAPATGTGLAPNVASFLCYLLTWVTGLIFLLIEKENKVVRFHAIQAIGLGAAWGVLWIVAIPLGSISFVGALIMFAAYLFLGVGMVILWILLMVRAYQGQMTRLPIIGDIAARYAGI